MRWKPALWHQKSPKRHPFPPQEPVSAASAQAPGGLARQDEEGPSDDELVPEWTPQRLHLRRPLPLTTKQKYPASINVTLEGILLADSALLSQQFSD